MNLSAEEFVNDYLVNRRLVGPTRAAKVASLIDAWVRLELTGPHSRQVEDLLAALKRVRDAAKAPQNRGAMTQPQMCRFLDGLLAEIEPAITGARDGNKHDFGGLMEPDVDTPFDGFP